MFWLLVSLAALAVGPVTFSLFGASSSRRARIALEVLVVLAVGGLVVLHILPEVVREAGWLAMVPLVLGLLGPTLTERWLRTFVDPAHLLVRIIVVVGLAVHAVFDGLALGVPGSPEHPSEALPMAVALHRVPVGLVLWWLLRPAHGLRVAGGVLGLIALCTLLGFLTGGAVAEHVHGPALALFQAWVAGSLLHVVVHPFDSHAGHRHDHSEPKTEHASDTDA